MKNPGLTTQQRGRLMAALGQFEPSFSGEYRIWPTLAIDLRELLVDDISSRLLWFLIVSNGIPVIQVPVTIPDEDGGILSMFILPFTVGPREHEI